MIKYDEFKEDCIKDLYEIMWKDNEFVKKHESMIIPTPVGKGIGSKNSYSFAGDDKEKVLRNIFGIVNKELFHEKFEQACGGSGQEYRRITTLHSSSLCALLFFYNISENNALKLNLEERTITFTKSVFEFKTSVIAGPSNMDVVLVGKDEKGKSVVLFLESKFSEYYTSASYKSEGISIAYENNEFSSKFYEDSFLNKLGIIKETDGNGIRLKSKNKFYITGIKQMISHYIGIRNSLNNKFITEGVSKSHTNVVNLIKNGADIILAEILFDKIIGDLETGSEQTCLGLYSQAYEILARKFNEEIDMAGLSNRFVVLNHELKYSCFKSKGHSIEPEIKEFYNICR